MKNNIKKISLYISFVIILSCAGFLFWQNNDLQNTIKKITSELEQVKEKLSQTETDKVNLSTDLDTEKALNNSLQEQIGGISTVIGTIEKLNKLDKDLLVKYSKIYFLNENYIPSSLTDIDSGYLYDPKNPLQIHTSVWPRLKTLLDDAKNNNINLEIISAYRSFGTQSALKSTYKVTYGSGANKFSADQGYSEHQLGTTIDFTTKETGADFSKFEKAKAYTWLNENAYKYGFILSYPKNNKYYVYEPWHWRFVGTILAKKLHADNKYFYDLDQREIDKYLISIFD